MEGAGSPEPEVVMLKSKRVFTKSVVWLAQFGGEPHIAIAVLVEIALLPDGSSANSFMFGIKGCEGE